MVPNESPLNALKDIHMPAPIGLWPLAPGWYALILCVLLAVAFIILWGRRFYQNGDAKRQALHLLELFQKQYQKNGQCSHTCARISELLRRVAMAYYPRVEVASLKDDAWIDFLNQTSNGLNFDEFRHELLRLPYSIEKVSNLNPLFKAVRAWIRQRRGRCLH